MGFNSGMLLPNAFHCWKQAGMESLHFCLELSNLGRQNLDECKKAEDRERERERLRFCGHLDFCNLTDFFPDHYSSYFQCLLIFKEKGEDI